METNNSQQSVDDEPNAKRQKIDADVSTSSKLVAKDPFLSLPSDIIVKIIGNIPVAQWASLELVDKNFRAATWIAWRQLRCINVDRDLLIKHANAKDRSLFNKSIGSILLKLVERSPFLTSLSVFDSWRYGVEESYSVANPLLVQFEHLQSFTAGRHGIQLDDVIEFLGSTRSRTSLKELQLLDVWQRHDDRPTLLDELASAFANGREIQSPLKLEKLVFASSFHLSLDGTLDILDTTLLIDLRVGKLWIEPHHLTNLIERASNLRRIELSFLYCFRGTVCNGHRLQANKKLLSALASHEKLTAIKFDSLRGHIDTNCWDFGLEFIEMLKTIGRRGLLRKFTLDARDAFSSIACMNEICATIRDHLHNLQSIELKFGCKLMGEGVFNIVSLTELEEINIMKPWSTPVPPNAVETIAQGLRLKRLAIIGFKDGDTNSPKCLANVTTLRDLRIENARNINAAVFDKWSEGFVPNLQVLMLRSIGAQDKRDAEGLVRLLEKAVQLRVLILNGLPFTDLLLMAIAKSCPKLEILGVGSAWNEINVRCWQEIVDHCPKLTRLGGLDDGIRRRLQFPKYRKIGRVDMRFWEHDLDDHEYE